MQVISIALSILKWGNFFFLNNVRLVIVKYFCYYSNDQYKKLETMWEVFLALVNFNL